MSYADGINLKSAGAAPFLYYTYREDGRLSKHGAMWTSDPASVTRDLVTAFTSPTGVDLKGAITDVTLAVTVFLLVAVVPPIATAVRGYVEWIRS